MNIMEFNNSKVECFNGIGEFVHIIESRSLHDGWGKRSSEEIVDRDLEFYGTKTYKESRDKALCGDEEKYYDLMEGVRQRLRNFTSRENHNKTKMRNYYCGGSPNVARAMLGVPRDMRQMHTTPEKQKTIEIIYGAEYLCNVTSKQVLDAGAKVLCLIELLERDGYRTKLSVMGGTNPRGECGCTTDIGYVVCLKDYGERCDMGKLGFPLANSGFFRRLGFRWIESNSFLTKKGRISCYGGSCTDLKRDLRHSLPKGKFFISFDDARRLDVETWINDNIK